MLREWNTKEEDPSTFDEEKAEFERTEREDWFN